MHLHDQDQNNLFCTEYKKEDDNQLFRFNYEDIVKVKSVYKDIFRDHQKQKQITHPYHIYISSELQTLACHMECGRMLLIYLTVLYIILLGN